MNSSLRIIEKKQQHERRDKYERFKIYLHSVLICPVLGSPIWGVADFWGWEWEVLWSAPVPSFLGRVFSSMSAVL